MADDDEIDILGDFSFNSCLAQNNQGIPSCSDREDTVHPQWLQDCVSSNWYDIKSNDRPREGPSRKLSGNSTRDRFMNEEHAVTEWSQAEKDLLDREMEKYGRNVRKISQILKTKTEAEIQALIEAEYGVHLDTPFFGLERHDDLEDVPNVVQEEIVTEDIPNVLGTVSTGSPTIAITKKPFRKKGTTSKSLLKPNALPRKRINTITDPSEIFYEDQLNIGSTESIGPEMDSMDLVYQKAKQQLEKGKTKAMSNHRRKGFRNYDRGRPRNKSKELLKSPQGRQRKDSSLSEDSAKSPKMQILLGSGLALPVSEGEQVIKIEKKKDSEPESDIEVDVDSDSESQAAGKAQPCHGVARSEAGCARVGGAPASEMRGARIEPRRFERMPRRQKKINLDGGGGCTIMHTAAGDLYEISNEPRRERAPKPTAEPLIPCRVYNADRPAPFSVRLHVSALLAMDAHAHSSRAEVMGLAGGQGGEGAGTMLVTAYRPARASAERTHCDMDPVSQLEAASWLSDHGLQLVAWHHSHPAWPAWPSVADLQQQRLLQRSLPLPKPVALITSQHWPTGRTASQYRCIRVEDDSDSESEDPPSGYQLSVRLVNDVTAASVPRVLRDLRDVLCSQTHDRLAVDMARDVCPQAGITYLEKCISSASHHLRSAGYADDDIVVQALLEGIRDVFR